MTVALTIAGSDSGGGAGIQADLKTFEAHGLFGTSAITSITAQNTTGVSGVWDLEPEAVKGQIEAVLDDFPVAAIKIGMLSNARIIEAVADTLEERNLTAPVVLDPVMVATSGDRLLRDDAVESLITRLFPLSTLVTPNAAEAEALCGYIVDDREAIRTAAEAIRGMGPRAVLVKGGDREERDEEGRRIAYDLYFDGERYEPLQEEYIESESTHGTGCTLSSAIAAHLALGEDLIEAIRRAKRYVAEAIRTAPNLGIGHGPMNHRIPIL